jgi:chemotaxis protein methyltransferase WspC
MPSRAAMPLPPVKATAPADAAKPVRGGLAHAHALADAGQLGEAHVDCMRWLARHPVDAEAWYLLGLIESAGGRFDAADEAFGRVLYLERDHADALAQRIGLAERFGRTAQARELRARAARLRDREARP